MQDGMDMGSDFVWCVGFGDVVVGIEFQIDDVVGVIVFGGQYYDWYVVFGVDVVQGVDIVQVWYYYVQYGDGVLVGECFGGIGFVVMGDVDFEFFLFQVFFEYFDELYVIVD